METNTTDSIREQIHATKDILSKNLEALKSRSEQLKDLFKQKETKKGIINDKTVNISLTNMGAIIINFVDIEEAKKYYDTLK